MDSPKSVIGIDHDQYRRDVLLLPSEESEIAVERNLFEEARRLGLEISDIEVAASLAASITSSIAELSSSSPVVSSVCSSPITADRNSFCDATSPTTTVAAAAAAASRNPSSMVDKLSSSLSDIVVSSNRVMSGGSTRSIASLSTRPTSFCSSEGKPSPGYHEGALGRLAHRNSSALNVISSDKKEKRRRSLIAAFGKIYPHSRKTRSPSIPSSPSTVLLPGPAQFSRGPGEGGRFYAQLKREDVGYGGHNNNRPDNNNNNNNKKREILKVEIPVFDDAALQRSLNDPELAEMLESHRSERNRHIAFQNASLSQLRRKQQAIVAERLFQHKRTEDEKREKNTLDASRIEERQLAVEMEQQREFERAKMNSRTRIKHMERYFNNPGSPPPPTTRSKSQSSDGDGDSDDTTESPDIKTTTKTAPPTTTTTTIQPTRKFTTQQKAQLAQEHHNYDSMDQLHEAKIKVLRDRQEMKLQESIARMEKELDDLIDLHAKDFAKLQRQHQREEAALLRAVDEKKTALRRRWYLEEAILRRKLEMQHGRSYGPLPAQSFSDEHERDETRDSAICVSADGNNAGGRGY